MKARGCSQIAQKNLEGLHLQVSYDHHLNSSDKRAIAIYFTSTRGLALLVPLDELELFIIPETVLNSLSLACLFLIR